MTGTVPLVTNGHDVSAPALARRVGRALVRLVGPALLVLVVVKMPDRRAILDAPSSRPARGRSRSRSS